MKNNIVNIQHDTKRRVVGVFAKGSLKISEDIVFKESAKIQGHYYCQVPEDINGNVILFIYDRTGSTNRHIENKDLFIDKGEITNGFSVEDRKLLQSISSKQYISPDNKGIASILENVNILKESIYKLLDSKEISIIDNKIDNVIKEISVINEKSDNLKLDFKNILSSIYDKIKLDILSSSENILKETSDLNSLIENVIKDINKEKIRYNYCTIQPGENTLPVNIKYNPEIKSGFIYFSSGKNIPVQIKKFNEEISFVSFDFTEESDYIFYIPGLYYLFIKCCKDSEVLTKENKIQIEQIAKKLMIL